MAGKTQLATTGEQQAAIVINNSFIDGLVKQLEKKMRIWSFVPKRLQPKQCAHGGVSDSERNKRQK